MSLLSSLISSLTGSGEDDSFTPPHALCPGSCPIGPEACERCLPYKQQLNDALYNVDHLEEFLDRYVVGTAAAGATECPHCGAPSGDPFICEYCGLQIQPDDGKIRVASANDIPDPIIEARDIVYARQSEVVSQYSQPQSSGGLLSGLLDLLDGSTEEGLGSRMSKEEIQQAAALYGVSISSYLNGLDNGTYLTLEKKQELDQASQHSAVGAGIGLTGGAVLGGMTTYGSQYSQRPPQRPPVYQPQSVHQANRPPRKPQQSYSRPQQPVKPPQQPAAPTQRPAAGKFDKPSQSFNRVDQARRPEISRPAAKPQQNTKPQSAKPQSPQRPQQSAPKGKENGNPGVNSIKGFKK